MSEPGLSVLIVGAGQVGIVFGHHLARAGARVGFLVKPKHEAETKKGFTLYPLNRGRGQRWRPERLEPAAFEVLTEASQAAAARWDYVLLSLPSSGLRGPWFDELVAACPDARFVTFQLGLGDREWIGERLPDARVMAGMLALVSYAAPIADEPVTQPGTAYWFPFGAPLPFSGPDRAAVERLVAALEQGGLPAKLGASKSSGGSRLPDFFLMSLVGALSLCDWRFAELSPRAGRARLAIRAAREAGAIDDKRSGSRAPWLEPLVTPALLRLVGHLARWLVPLPFEAFLKVHFTKVSPQMVRDRALHIEAGKQLGMPHAAIEELLRETTPPQLQ